MHQLLLQFLPQVPLHQIWLIAVKKNVEHPFVAPRMNRAQKTSSEVLFPEN